MTCFFSPGLITSTWEISLCLFSIKFEFFPNPFLSCFDFFLKYYLSVVEDSPPAGGDPASQQAHLVEVCAWVDLNTKKSFITDQFLYG